MNRLSERAGDADLRRRANELVSSIEDRLDRLTVNSGVARVSVPDEALSFLAYDWPTQKRVLADSSISKNGYGVIRVNFPAVIHYFGLSGGSRDRRKRVSMNGMKRGEVVSRIREWFELPSPRSLLVHEAAHIVFFFKGSGDYPAGDDYYNNHEEVTAWFNQAVNELIMNAKRGGIGEMGSDPGEFTSLVLHELDSHGILGKLSERNRRAVMKRAYTGWEDAVRAAGLKASSKRYPA